MIKNHFIIEKYMKVIILILETIPYFWKQPFMKDEDPSAWCAEKNEN